MATHPGPFDVPRYGGWVRPSDLHVGRHRRYDRQKIHQPRLSREFTAILFLNLK